MWLKLSLSADRHLSVFPPFLPLRPVTSKTQTSILSIIISRSTYITERSEDYAVEGRVEMTEHNEQGWEEVTGIQEEPNQSSCDRVQEQV